MSNLVNVLDKAQEYILRNGIMTNKEKGIVETLMLNLDFRTDKVESFKNAFEELKDSYKYGKKAFEKRFDEENDHYKYLLYGIRAKIVFQKYYFPKEPIIGSRKLVAHSEDCISLIHVIPRKESLNVIVYMRSSDVIELLPVDLAGILYITDQLYEDFLYKDDAKINIKIILGSAHIYKFGRNQNREEIEDDVVVPLLEKDNERLDKIIPKIMDKTKNR
jgi:hypothetical protein